MWRRGRGAGFAGVLATVLCAAATAPGASHAAASPSSTSRGPSSPATTPPALPTIVQDDAQLLHRSEPELRASLAQLQALGVSTVRVTAGWSVLTRAPDAVIPPLFDQADPAAYEQARFAALDRLVRLAPGYGLSVMIDIAFWAPHWAAADPPGPRARTDVDPAAYARFATAIARRYSGTYTPRLPPAGAPAVRSTADDRLLDRLFSLDGAASSRSAIGSLLAPPAPSPDPAGPLPRVSTFTLWNEPNHPAFLQPQWVGRGQDRRPASPAIYRRMVQAAYPAIKAVQPGATVLVGATAAQSAGDKGVAPLRFLRSLACVDDDLRPITDGSCRGFTPIPGDGWAHHPYSLRTLPAVHAADPDQVPIADLGRLTGLLGRLVAAGRLAPGLGDVWVTEYGYETDPPEADARFSTGDQARFLTWAEYLAWRTPHVRSFAQFLLRDLPPAPDQQTQSLRRSMGQWQSGLAFADGRPKLASETFSAGLFVHRSSHPDRVLAWGRIRRADPGAVTVELQVRRRGHHWKVVRTHEPGRSRATRDFPAAGVISRVLARVPGARYRLRVRAGPTAAWTPSPSVAPVG